MARRPTPRDTSALPRWLLAPEGDPGLRLGPRLGIALAVVALGAGVTAAGGGVGGGALDVPGCPGLRLLAATVADSTGTDLVLRMVNGLPGEVRRADPAAAATRGQVRRLAEAVAADLEPAPTAPLLAEGRRLVDELAAAGHDPVVWARASGDRAELLSRAHQACPRP